MLVFLGFRGADGGSDGVASMYEIINGNILDLSHNWRQSVSYSREGYYYLKIFGYTGTFRLDRPVKKIPYGKIATSEGTHVEPGTIWNSPNFNDPSGHGALYGYAYVFE